MAINVEQAAPALVGTQLPAPPASTEQPSARRELDRSLVRGMAWTGAVKWVTQVATWGVTIIVARLLTPNDFGMVGMATVYLGLTNTPRTLVSRIGDSSYGLYVYGYAVQQTYAFLFPGFRVWRANMPPP